MKYLKLYEDFNESDPFDEEDWSERKLSLMQSYVGKKLICVRMDHGIDVSCAIFHRHNERRCGMGIRGNYFDEESFTEAIEKRGDCLKRFLYDLSDEEDIRLLFYKMWIESK
jgi:hypothetical protein